MASPNTNLPVRQATDGSDDVVGPGEDASEVTKLFHERLQAYKHACRYLEDYIQTSAKMQTAHSKEYEKVLKSVNQPLKEGEMFDRNAGGIAEFFDKVRNSTLAISNSHAETSKSLDSVVLPIFKRLHSEIKSKQSELAKGAGKAGKAVDKARADTNKHIEKLGTASATFEQVHSKADSSNDPYVLQRGIYHRLNKQFQEENSAKQDMLAVQDNFSQFESHIIQTFQQGMGSLLQTLGGQLDVQKQQYSLMVESIQNMDPLFEWQSFVQRSQGLLIDRNAPPKSIQNASFPNKDHRSTKPMIQGTLERKSGALRKFSSSVYVVTPAKFLHQFSTDDDLAKDPTPELSLYLPNCTLGGLNGNLFSVKGKDISGGLSKLGQAREYEFRATSASEAETWWGNIRAMASQMPSSEPNTPLSPVEKRDVSGASATPVSPVSGQESETVAAASPISPAAATSPATATSPTAPAAEEKPISQVADPTAEVKQ